MKRRIVEASKKLLAHTPYEFRQRRSSAQSLSEAVALLRDLHRDNHSFAFVGAFLESLIDPRQVSHAQIAQDLFALAVASKRRDGYFVEFGAADGINYSNSYLLENKFSWKGIVAEPNRAYWSSIAKTRTCHFDKDCIWSRTGDVISFTETEEGTLSTISQFVDSDHHDRRRAKCYDVRTVSLDDLLVRHQAPEYIDYISLDTEGSELDILAAFDFSRYRFNALTVEHNFVERRRQEIFRLLRSKGYIRVLEEFTQFDDWYVHSSVVS